MSTTCPFCAEALPDAAVQRCSSCGERLQGQGAAPAPAPAPPVLAMIVGGVDVLVGAGCGLWSLNYVASLARWAISGGAAVRTELAVIAVIALAFTVIHVGAGLGVIARLRRGRLAGIACASLDLLLGLAALVVGARSRDDPQTDELGRALQEALHLLLAVGGGVVALLAGLALWILVRRATREAFAAHEAARAR